MTFRSCLEILFFAITKKDVFLRDVTRPTVLYIGNTPIEFQNIYWMT